MFFQCLENCVITDHDRCTRLGVHFLLLVFAKICFRLLKKKKIPQFQGFLGKDNVGLCLKEHKGKKG